MAGDIPRSATRYDDTPRGSTTGPAFTVLLGADHVGKSTVLSGLAAGGWQCVSYDDDFLPAGCSLIAELRECFVSRALHGIGRPYSTDFVLSLLQTSVIYLRDQAIRADPARPVIIDSYYYKILAKCVLTGLVDEPMFAWWRSFPQPRLVVYLDVDPVTAWRRSGDGARLNAFEHYGDTPTLEAFRRFQLDLRELMLHEVAALPVSVLGQDDDPERLIGAIRSLTGGSDAGRRAA